MRRRIDMCVDCFLAIQENEDGYKKIYLDPDYATARHAEATVNYRNFTELVGPHGIAMVDLGQNSGDGELCNICNNPHPHPGCRKVVGVISYQEWE